MAKIINGPADSQLAELERKHKRLTVIMLGFVVPAVIITGIAGFYFLANISNPITTAAHTEKADWQIRELNSSGGLSIESPFPLATQAETNYDGGHMELYSYSYYNSYQFNIAISYYRESGRLPDLDEEVERIIDRASSTEGLQYYSTKIDSVYYKDIPGRKISGVFVSERAGNKYITSVYVRDENLWVVQCFFLGNDTNTSIAERIINSVKITNN